jgi:hypothetical protein
MVAQDQPIAREVQTGTSQAPYDAPMNKLSRPLFLVFAFVAGCAGAEVAQYVVPPAHAGVPVQRWEYTCQDYNEGITAMANQFGQQGWEMVAAAGAGWGAGLGAEHRMVWCFKRPLP